MEKKSFIGMKKLNAVHRKELNDIRPLANQVNSLYFQHLMCNSILCTSTSKDLRMEFTRRFSAALVVLLAVLFVNIAAAQQGAFMGKKADAPKAGQFDTGKMWTFDFPPIDYFAATYPGFNPTKEWFEKARLGAVRLQGCSGSFVSEDGLVMTNHHCARGAIDKVMKEGENLHETGFWAPTLADERKIPGAYIDQLVSIEDVTKEILDAFNSGSTPEEQVSKRNAKMKELTDSLKAKTGNEYQVVTFYNGGRYSLYGYKRYNDIRLVFAPETRMGFFGGDPDNFTFPRYDYDCSFYRIYEDDKPLKTANFFKFNPKGAEEGEAIFVIGNPGRTSRLRTVAQLEYFRDYQYSVTSNLLDNLLAIYKEYVEKHPEERVKMENMVFGIGNSQKLFTGMLKGLRDENVMGRKRDFEANFKAKVMAKPELAQKYGAIWDEIAAIQKEKMTVFTDANMYNARGPGKPVYFGIAAEALEYAKQMSMPSDKRSPKFKDEMLDSTKAKMFPADVKTDLQAGLLRYSLELMQSLYGSSSPAVNELLGGQSPGDAAQRILAASVVVDKEKLMQALAGDASAVMSDPIVKFIAATDSTGMAARQKLMGLNNKESAAVQNLGTAMYDVFGTSIPPDATFTLRIADGVVKGYGYNGTIAPPFTTFYGMYDRYYSFKSTTLKDWELPERWVKAPASFNYGAKLNFVGTSDIIGGNSGSPVINKNHEIVGLVFDGNIESLPSDIIYLDENYRMVAVHPEGIMEGIKSIYKATRLYDELSNGKLAPEKPAKPAPKAKKK